MAIQNKLVNILWHPKNVILCGKPPGARRNNIVLLFVAQLDLRMFLFIYLQLRWNYKHQTFFEFNNMRNVFSNIKITSRRKNIVKIIAYQTFYYDSNIV